MKWLRDPKTWSLANMVYDKTSVVPPKNSLKSFIFEVIRKKRDYDDKIRLLVTCRASAADVTKAELQEILHVIGTPFYSYREAMESSSTEWPGQTLAADYFDFLNNKRSKP